jgi:hypothetical protein
MALDQAKIGNVAARLMEQLEEIYGEDAMIEHVMLLVAVDQTGRHTIHFNVSEGIAPYEGIGMLEVVRQRLLTKLDE